MGIPRGVVLAAGLGTRLRPLTDRTPKCLIPVAGRPIIDYWIRALADAGVRDVLINTHHLPDQVRAWMAKVNDRIGMHIHEAYEPELLGSAGTLAHNGEFAADADEVIIIYADNFSDVDLRAMLDFHRAHDDPFTMLLFHAPNPRACGIAELDRDQRIVSFIEKPEAPKSDLANAGVYIVDRDAWQEMVDAHAFDLGHDVLPKFVGRMRGYAGADYHLDVGTHEAYERVQQDAPRVLARRRADDQGRRPAIFLDRDGTLIENAHYLSRTEDVHLIPGAADAVRRFRAAGYLCVVVSNQSAIGRGIITEDDHRRISDHVCDLFAREGAVFDALYHNPHVPQGKGRTAVEHPDRKPGPGMLLTAASELHLNLAASWMVGDFVSDVLAGHHAGCQGNVYIGEPGDIADADLPEDVSCDVVPDMAAAADLILNQKPIPGAIRS
ncbi:MAG: HAD-IIIA family hydrolase [Phycisphaerales bacterium]|nr:HAD-IIIA family hydrolase [Phycisphaerales bacterium]